MAWYRLLDVDGCVICLTGAKNIFTQIGRIELSSRWNKEIETQKLRLRETLEGIGISRMRYYVREGGREGGRDSETERDRERQRKERETETARQRETEAKKERQRETERDRET